MSTNYEDKMGDREIQWAFHIQPGGLHRVSVQASHYEAFPPGLKKPRIVNSSTDQIEIDDSLHQF